MASRREILMACIGHRDGTASVSCSTCASPGCPECLEQVDNSFYCTNCLLQRLQEAEFEAYEAETTTLVRDSRLEAKRRVRRNWILTAIASVVIVPAVAGVVIEDDSFPSALKFVAGPIAGILAAYVLWAALWGIPAAWRWWKGLFAGTSALIVSSEFGWLLLAVSFFFIPIYFGYLYGVFGGAIYEYRKNLKIAAGLLLPDPA
jgi:hypothetical protein